jgi:hypothetical protein
VYATNAVPTLYAATQTLSGTAFTTPAITGAVVVAGASGTGTITLTYKTGTVADTMVCPTTLANVGSIQSEFVYSNGGTPAYPSLCAIAGGAVVLKNFVSATTGATGVTLVLPTATDTLTYTSPAAPVVATEVNATGIFPNFPATQTFTMSLSIVPVMVSAAVATNLLSLAITYNEAVSCPTTYQAPEDGFVYNSGFGTVGGGITGCSSAGDVLTLAGVYNAATGSASIVYTSPAGTTVNTVYATGTTADLAATQTLLPL